MIKRRAVYALFAAGAAVSVACAVYGRDAKPDPWPQGWNPKQTQNWYSAYQGSRLIPEAWLQALEQPNSQTPFLDKAYVQSFGYLVDGAGAPIGFAEDVQDDSKFVDTHLRWKANQGAKEPWVGLTCSACHTNDIQEGDRVQRVDGGSTLADFQSFIEAFDLALAQTRDDPAKFDRFSAKVLGGAQSPDKAKLRGALDQLVKLRQKTAGLDKTPIRYGPARLDAVGYIYNKVEQVVNPDAPQAPAPDAPVSYPFLWNTSQQTQIQWDGVAKNTPIKIPPANQVVDVGAAGRNAAEVTGVFGDVIAPRTEGKAFITSIHMDNLIGMEQQLQALKAPKWPRDVYPIDQGLAAEGGQLYKVRCASCHFELARDDLKTRYRPADASGNKRIPIEKMSYFKPRPGEGLPADTDPWMACNAATDTAPVGMLSGRKSGIGSNPVFYGDSSLSDMLTYTVVQELLSKKGALAKAAIESAFGVHPGAQGRPPVVIHPLLGASPGAPEDPHMARLRRCMQAADNPATYKAFAYKARPLNGVWATGPFLHNGSVPTLYDLLLPPDQRPTRFGLGSHKLDARHVGFESAPGGENRFTFETRDAAGKPIPGNSNAGHDYGNASLTEHQRMAIVEYLKIIGEKTS